jgi:hypothetical protein
MANIEQKNMSIEKQSNKPQTTAHKVRGLRLTITNLATHDQNVSSVASDHAVRCWLNDIEPLGGRYVDSATWTRLVERDPMAAAIENATKGGDQTREWQG